MNGAPGAYDPATKRLIVFGGRDHTGANLNDVWVLTNANGLGGTGEWINLIPNGAAGSPPARSGHAMVYDATNNRLIVFGGCGGYCVPALNDVWVLSNANGLGGTPVWTQLLPASAPPARTNMVAAYDPSHNWLIVVGGQDGSADPCSTISDVWVLSNANGLGGTPAWSSSAPGNAPPGRNGAASAYDPVTGVLTSFGGMNLVSGVCQPTNVVWTLSTNPSPLLGSWQVAFPEGTLPSSRSFSSAVYDSQGGRMLVFGGQKANGGYLNDVWSLSNATGLGHPTWSAISPNDSLPPARDGQAAGFDPGNRRMTIFAGANTSGVLNDAWVLTSPGVSQLSCTANAGIPNLVTAEGVAERVGDVLMTCTGGVPTTKGAAIPEFTVSLTLNTNITSRRFPEATGLSAALLIVDEAFPASPIPSSAVPLASAPPQILCKPLGSTCAEKGTGGVGSPYQTQPNVFAATAQGQRTLQWKIPIDPPGVNNTRLIRLTNVLANASQLGVPAGLTPKVVEATVGIQGTQITPLASQAMPVADSLQGVSDSVVSTATIPQCLPHNAVLLGKTGTAAFDFSIQIRENVIAEFQYRNYGTFLFGPEFPPSIVEQNVPGFPYVTESGFYSPSLFTPAPTLGLADSGMRILVSVGPLSAGTQLFVPTTITLTGGYAPDAIAGELQLVQTDQNGKSAAGYIPVASTGTIGATPVAPAGISGSTAYAAYEVIYADPTVQETGVIPFAVAFTDAKTDPATGTAYATTSLAPLGTNGAANQTSPIPRFVNLSSQQQVYSIQACK